MNQQVENIMNDRPIGQDYFRVRQMIKKRPRPQTKDSVLNIDERAHHSLTIKLMGDECFVCEVTEFAEYRKFRDELSLMNKW